jgi:FAD/FMN-containing dehydrogenase/Fe-S oxidoreductase
MDEIKILGFEGDIYTDESSLLIYSTDASAYREIPLAVTYPKTKEDVQKLVHYANDIHIGLIPRTAGTSLAGQVVGNGIVVDFSRYMNKILEINVDEKWVKVQPGVVLDELNLCLKESGLFFGPETSTSNRCMIGGMVGNNACGAHSLIYGSTRDHLLEVKGYLSDGNEIVLKKLKKPEFDQKCLLNNLEGQIYQKINQILTDPDNRSSILNEYPDAKLKRRNTGYALDLLLNTIIFSDTEELFNLTKLVAGSEGTLMLLTEIKLNLVPLPPKNKGLICIHFKTLEEALQANLIALTYKPGAIELIDSIILNCTKDNIEQRKNRFFISGDPGAILIVEFARDSIEEIKELASRLQKEMQDKGYGTHFPLVLGEDINKVWALRKAALGLLTNIPGDAKPVSLVEDTAVLAEKLPDYIADFKKILAKYNLQCVFHAHIATGELHLRPVLNLKEKEHVRIFRAVATEVAILVKKYKGSISGEHGDGRLRGEFIPVIIGAKNFELVKQIKFTWDPNNIFNPGKIVDTPPMDTNLRYVPGAPVRNIKTYFDFSDSKGYIRHVERCNGSGDCRKSEIIGGTMCPSYMATRKESATTRARANILREYITNSTNRNPFDHKEVYDILDLCLSCKACKSECPSNVDMTKLKAEFQQHYYNANGIPLRSRIIGNMTFFYKLGSHVPDVFNFFAGNKTFSQLIKSVIRFAPQRNIPLLSSITVKKWSKKNLEKHNNTIGSTNKEVYLFVDEFTNYLDAEIGIKTIMLLNKLGYKVNVAECYESGRTCLSKGMVKKAIKIATKNVKVLSNVIGPNTPLVGIEPSSILTFRDEYPELVPLDLVENARKLASKAMLIEEFIAEEIEKGNINNSKFTNVNTNVILHGHCYIKAIASTKPVKTMLSLPKNYKVTELPSGCCGMAGAFGFEKEHYEVSMKVGEMVLFPAIRKTHHDTIIAASGISCRHQIKEGTGREAYHPVEILYNALL